MKYYNGYGVNIRNKTRKGRAFEFLYDAIIRSNSKLAKDIEEYYVLNSNKYSSSREAFPDYCELWFKNEETERAGMEEVIVSFINERNFKNKRIFVYEEGFIHVASYIPNDNLEKELMPTISEIDECIRKYVNPLFVEKLTGEWKTITIY